MSYFLTFSAGALFSIATVLFVIGKPGMALEYALSTGATLFCAWLFHAAEAKVKKMKAQVTTLPTNSGRTE